MDITDIFTRKQTCFVFVYANKYGTEIRFFGHEDATAYHTQIIELGYKHVATIDACIVLEYLAANKAEAAQWFENLKKE